MCVCQLIICQAPLCVRAHTDARVHAGADLPQHTHCHWPIHDYVGAPSLAWDAMLLMTGVELDLLKDSLVICVYSLSEVFVVVNPFFLINKYAEANKKYVEDYDEDMDNTFYICILFRC